MKIATAEVLKKVRFSREAASVLLGCMIQDTGTKVNNAPQNFFIVISPT